MEYYQRLKEIREDKDLTQKEIANIINSSQQHYHIPPINAREKM